MSFIPLTTPKIHFLDFDGVIVNTSGIKLDLYRDILKELHPGKEELLKEAFAGPLVGGSRHEIASWLQEKMGAEFDSTKYIDLFTKRLDQSFLNLKVDPTFTKYLSNCNEKGITVAIVSSAPSKEIEDVLSKNQIDSKKFYGIYGFEFGRKSNIMNKILSDLKISANDAMMVGDMPTDAKSSFEAKVPFVRFNNDRALGFWPEEVLEMQPSVKNFLELLN